MITTSPDGQWAAVRNGRELVLLAGGAGAPVGRLELTSDDADVVIVGPPAVLAVIYRGEENKVVLHQPPYLEAVARLDLEAPLRLAAITGPRMVLVSSDHKAVTIVRAAGRALSAQPLDPGSLVEFAVGLDRNQILLGLLRKLEVWDAVSARPLLRLQLQMPPPPRTVGSAHGHVWATRPGSDEVFVYRLSDGRPFRHFVGAPVDAVVSHAASPLIVLVTSRGLVRLHCFAHSLHVIDDSPWTPGAALAQLVVGDDISLLGLTAGTIEPWRVPIGGAGAPTVAIEPAEGSGEPLHTAADKLRAMRDRSVVELGSRLTSIAQPTSIVWGQHDPWIGVEVGERGGLRRQPVGVGLEEVGATGDQKAAQPGLLVGVGPGQGLGLQQGRPVEVHPVVGGDL